MKRLSFIAAALLCFVTVVSAAIRPAQPGIGGGGSTVSGSITGAYSFNGPFSTVNATNVYLNAGISNLAINLALTNANANQFSTSGGTAIKSGSLQTNNVFYGTHVISGPSTNVGVNPYVTSQDAGGGNAGFLAIGGGNALYLTTSLLGLAATNSAEGLFYLWGGTDGSKVTAEFAPTGVVFYGHVGIATNLTVGKSVTASSFIGSGTGVPIIKLQTMMSADNAFAITVATNRTATTTNTFDFTSVAVNDVIKVHSSSAGQVVWTNGSPTIFTPVAISGVGGANTNFTLLVYQPEVYINGFTNVSIRGVMGYDAANVAYWTCVITNGSGSDRTIEFSAVTNRYRFNGTYGTNAPVTLTNNTTLEISGRQVGTNISVAYGYFAWP